MSLTQTLFLTRLLFALSLLIQSFEMLRLGRTIAGDSPWNWSHLRIDWAGAPLILRQTVDFCLAERFRYLVYLQIIGVCWFIVDPNLPIALLLVGTNLLIALRFRGVFNGGSDSMTMVVLTSLLVTTLKPSEKLFEMAGIFYIAAQATLSYFVAGIVKLKSQSWRSGLALKVFIAHSNYSVPSKIRTIAQHSWFRPLGHGSKLIGSIGFGSNGLLRLASWFVIGWECAFPLLWFARPSMALTITLIFVGNAFLFHIGNFVAFGINRFVFAWLATYPALIFCAGKPALWAQNWHL